MFHIEHTFLEERFGSTFEAKDFYLTWPDIQAGMLESPLQIPVRFVRQRGNRGKLRYPLLPLKQAGIPGIS